MEEKISGWLKDGGYPKERKDIGCQHSEGLPNTVKVKVPLNWSPIDGDQALFITPSEVLRCTVSYPWGYNPWRIIGRYPYSNFDQLKQTLDSYVTQPSAPCWR